MTKRKQTSPLIEVDIVTLGSQGDGVASWESTQVFVPLTVPGDRVLARVSGRRDKALLANVVEVLRPGPGRITPPCPLFGQCGGCALQHLDEAHYTAWKRSLLTLHLAHQGLGEVPLAPLLCLPTASRRRATLAYIQTKGRLFLGFNARASHTIVDVSECLLLDPALLAIFSPLRSLLSTMIAPGAGGNVVLTQTETGLDLLVEGAAGLDLFDRERLAVFAEKEDLARLSWRRPGSGTTDIIARRRPVVVRFGGVAVEPPPGTFLQPTIAGERALVSLILEGVGKADTVADLYAGCGSFTFPLAQGRTVHAVEGEEAPLHALAAAARAAGLAITSEVRDLGRRPLHAQDLRRFKAVVFDPPRAGAAPQAEMLAEAGPATVVAVSCNPATLARDLRTLVGGGYRIESLTPIDQFPYSAHLEVVAVLRRA